MSNSHDSKVDMSKYFNRRQKVYLINASENRDHDLYESLSGTIVGRGGDSVAVQLTYPHDCAHPVGESLNHAYKLTTEVMGNGIQVIADLLRVEAGSILHLRLRSNLEMYQRRQAPRIDATIHLSQIQGSNSLDAFRREFDRISGLMKSRGGPPDTRMQEAAINLGVGGIRIASESGMSPSPLSLFLLGLEVGQLPVCALGDLVWNRLESGERVCGYRFIQISKADQERINGYILSLRKKQKISTLLPRTNWELMERMVYDGALWQR
jgi:hypothetical protein